MQVIYPLISPLADTIRRRADSTNKYTNDFIPKDDSNPYFSYDPAKCIVCSRCVRACEEVQGTFALTIEGRGFEVDPLRTLRPDVGVVELVVIRLAGKEAAREADLEGAPLEETEIELD